MGYYGKPIDLNGNELRNATIQNLGSAPPSPKAGQIWFDTVASLLKWFNGTAAIDPLARANHSGTQSRSTISDLSSQPLNQFAAPTGAVAMGTQNFSGLAAAASSGQAVEYAQFQTALANIATGMDLKEAQAQVVATANVNTASPGATISGHAMVNGDRVLLAGQTTASQNGLYVWSAAASPLTRSADANTAGSIMGGTMVVVGDEDTANPNTVWMQTATGTGTNGAIVIGTDSQNWIKVLSPVTYTAGNGISITAGVIAAVVAAAGGLTVSGAGLAVDTTKTPQKYLTSVTGDGTTTSWTITHNLGTTMPDVSVRINGAKWEVDDQVASAGASTTQVVIGISPAPANGTTINVKVTG